MRAYAAFAVALLATVALLAVRLASAPTGTGIRHAMAAAPNGGLYYAAPGRFLAVGRQGGVVQLGALTGGTPLALAADGDFLVLGTTSGVEVSTDAGRRWSAARLPSGHYPAVYASGSTAYAGQWAGALWATVDAGRSWQPTGISGGEYQAIASTRGELYVATLTTVMRSLDRGRTSEATGLPPRVTALEAEGDHVLAGTWGGDVYAAGSLIPPRLVTRLGRGIWALSGSRAATTDGIRGQGGVSLAGREVSALVASAGVLYAGIAGGSVEASSDGGRHWTQLNVSSSAATVT